MDSHRSRVLAFGSVVLFLLFIALAFVVYVPSPAHYALARFDSVLDTSVGSLRAMPAALPLMLTATFLGNVTTIIALTACTLALFLIHRKRELALLFLSGIAASESVSYFFKHVIARARPPEILFQVAHSGYSFPSGHALIAVVFYGSLAFFFIQSTRRLWLKNLAGIIAVCLIFAIGFSRIFLGVHWSSDVVGGWLLGGGFLALIAVLFLRYRLGSIS